MQNFKYRKHVIKIPQVGKLYAKLSKKNLLSVHQLTYQLLYFCQTTGRKSLTTIKTTQEKGTAVKYLLQGKKIKYEII